MTVKHPDAWVAAISFVVSGLVSTVIHFSDAYHMTYQNKADIKILQQKSDENQSNWAKMFAEIAVIEDRLHIHK